MITVEPFKEEDFERLISWIDKEEDLIQFAGPLFEYPLTEKQLRDYIESERRIPLKVKQSETGEIIGHCELNYTNEIPRLSRILIGQKGLRSRGLGKLIVQEMVAMIFKNPDYTVVDLTVYDWNLNAIKCYSKIGFRIRDGLESFTKVGDKEWRALTMVLEKNEWKQK